MPRAHVQHLEALKSKLGRKASPERFAAFVGEVLEGDSPAELVDGPDVHLWQAAAHVAEVLASVNGPDWVLERVSS